MTNKQDHAYKKWLTPEQLHKLRVTLFASAAASMGARIEQIESVGDPKSLADVIRSEWVVED
jgi:hypothetical protein